MEFPVGAVLGLGGIPTIHETRQEDTPSECRPDQTPPPQDSRSLHNCAMS